MHNAAYVASSAAIGENHNMPRAIVNRLHWELIKILHTPEVRDRILADGSEPVGSSPEEFRQFMLADQAKWAKVVKESGAKLD